MRLSVFLLLLLISSNACAEFSAPCPLQNSPMVFQPSERKVRVTILGARVLANADTDIWPFVDRADLFGTVQMDDQISNLSRIDGSDAPTWVRGNVFENTLATGASSMSIKISLIDQDGSVSGDDDVMDINPAPGVKQLEITFDACSLRFSVPGSTTTQATQGLITFRGDIFPDSEYGEIDLRLDFADGRPATSDDVALTELQPVQVIHNASGIVSDKPFVVMARVANNFNAVISTEIDISISGAGISRTDRFPINDLLPGEVRRIYFYQDTPLIPTTTGADLLYMTAAIDPAGKFTGELAGDDCRRRNDYIGAEPADGLRYAAYRINSPYVHWVRIRPAIGPTLSADTTRFRELATMGSDFAQAIYPVPSVGRNIDLDRWTPVVSAGILDVVLGIFNAIGLPANVATPFTVLFEMNFRAALGGVRKYVGVLQGDYLRSFLYGIWEDTPGVSLMTVGSRAVLVSEGWKNPEDALQPGEYLSSIALPVHELGHSYGLSVEPSIKDVFGCGVEDPLGLGELWCGIAGGYDEYTHADTDLRRGFPSTGYWVRRGGEHATIASLANSEVCETHGVMGSSARGDFIDWTNQARRKWIDRANYEFLFSRFVATTFFRTTAVDGEKDETKEETDSIVLAGVISYDDKTSILPLWRVGSRVPDLDSKDTLGLYGARFLSEDGKVLQDIGIPLDWVRSETGTPGIPGTFFTYVLPYPRGTAKIELVNRLNNKRLYSQKVSKTRPTIQFQNADKVITAKKGTKIKLAWKADDKDLVKKYPRSKDREKKLFYSVLLRDPGLKEDSKSYKVLESNLTRPLATIDTSALTKKDYRIKLLVSDGVNTSETSERRLKIQ